MKIIQKIKSAPIISSLSVLAIVGIGLGVFSINTTENLTEVEGTTSTNCGNAYMYIETPNMAVTHIYVDGSLGSEPIKIEVMRDGKIIGKAKPDSNFDWFMKIPTRLLEPVPKNTNARIFFNNGQVCETPPMADGFNTADFNTEPMFIDVIPSRNSIDTTVNSSVSLSAKIHLHPASDPNSEFFQDYAIYRWEVSGRGYVSPNQARFTSYKSGPNAGDGRVRVYVTYGEINPEGNSPIEIPTIVRSSDAPISDNSGSTLSPPDDNSMSTSSASQEDKEFEEEKQEIERATALESNDGKVSCIIAAIGQDRFESINNKETRPTLQELDKIYRCFAESKYILPSNFAPVAPDEIKNLPTSTKAKIQELKGEKRLVDGSEVPVIVLRGTAEPNSKIVLYVFSEPLVLTTTADSNGNWVYELDSPLESGDHEVYAVVDRGDGVFEKSDAFAFVIGTAEATPENPDGLSLDVIAVQEQASATDSRLSTVIYVVASAMLLIAIIGLATFAYKKGKGTKEKVQNNSKNDVHGVINSEPIQPTENNTQEPTQGIIQGNLANSGQEPQKSIDQPQNTETPQVVDPQLSDEVQKPVQNQTSGSSVTIDSESNKVPEPSDEQKQI